MKPAPKSGALDRIFIGVHWVGAILLSLVALLSGVIGFDLYASGRESHDWPAVQATVVSAEVFGRTRSTGAGDSAGTKPSSSSTSGSDVSYDLNVVFAYVVQDERFEHRRGFGTFSKRARAEEVQRAKYVPGQPLGEVYYDPGDPDRFELERGGDRGLTAFFSIFAVVALGLGVVLISSAAGRTGRPMWIRGATAAGILATIEVAAIVVYELVS